MNIKLHPLIYPDIEINKFIIKEKSHGKLKTDESTLVLSQKNIIHQFQVYIKAYTQYYRCIYVETRYGIIKGDQVWFNEKGHKDITYKIRELFETDLDALYDYVELEKSPMFKSHVQWVVYRDEHNQLVASEMSKAQQDQDNTQLKDMEYVDCKSNDEQILNFEAEHTNNLGVKFRVRCKQLYSLVRWIKYKGKIYRAVLYHTEFFQIEINGKFYGMNHATKSQYINHMTFKYGEIAPSNYMQMRRIWIVDEGLGGLSVRQYRRLRNRLHNSLKKNNATFLVPNIPSLGIMHSWTYDDKDYKLDNSVRLYLDEVLRDITEEEKQNMTA